MMYLLKDKEGNNRFSFLHKRRTVRRTEQMSEKERMHEQLKDEIHHFVLHPALTQLMQFGFGYKPLKDATLAEEITHRRAFTNQYFDFRNGQERGQAEKGTLTLKQKALIILEARRLGLTTERKPKKKEYDAIVILGAGGMHPLWRTEQALNSGAKARLMVWLGSNYEFPKINPAYTTYASQAVTEFDLMTAAMQRVYGRETPTEEIDGSHMYVRVEGTHATVVPSPFEDWRVVMYGGAQNQDEKLDKPDIAVFMAPSSSPNRRANTPDTYLALARFLPKSVKNLLLVTSSNFAPFQEADAQRMLAVPYGVDIDVTGFDTRKTIYHSPQHYLQEINSALNSYALLGKAINV